MIIHRFTSPSWLKFLQAYVAVDFDQSAGDKGDAELEQYSSGSAQKALLASIMRLETGEALLMAPSAVVMSGPSNLAPLGGTILKIKVRDRMTEDGGKSVLVGRSRG